MSRRTLVLGLLLGLVLAAPASAAGLRVGVGRADLTPPTGTFKGGWACSCAKAQGQHTRLYARAVVLQEGDRKVALLNADLAFVGEGMVRDAVRLLKDRGFTTDGVIVSATHTHGSQSGFMNYGAFNSVLPRGKTLAEFNLTDTAADPVLYAFMTRQLAASIRRADDDLAAGAVGWGRVDLFGVTRNRSLEAALAGYGLQVEPGAGAESMAPGGYASTIDPTVDVLRVDKIRRGKRIPVGMFSSFANHGTAVGATFDFYTADHQGNASRVVEATIRREGRVPPGQEVVNAFANGDAGDMSSGLDAQGPAHADEVGRQEAGAMLRAWRSAARAMTRTPRIDLRTTRVCFCGQDTGEGKVDTQPIIGLAAASGSEELRSVFYDLGLAREGRALPVGVGPQGRKIPTLPEGGNVPIAVPITVMRVGDRMIATFPGEATAGLGRMVRAAVAASGGVDRVVFAGYANDYLDYFTTPAEYDRQHYEGGFTMYGRTSSLVLRDGLADLAGRLRRGEASPEPYAADDPNNGVQLTDAEYGEGAARADVTEQPEDAARLEHPAVAWTGGADGIDRPVDAAFVTVERAAAKGRWTAVTDDLGVQLVWSSTAAGAYRARWEVPLSARAGSYRFRVTGKRYTFTSAPFSVAVSSALIPAVDGDAVVLRHPAARMDEDWTWRPPTARGGVVRFRVDGGEQVVRSARRFRVPAGKRVVIPARAAQDRYGNTNAEEIVVR